MYAIALIGSRQYKISEGDTIQVGRLVSPKKSGDISLDKVLLYSKGHQTKVGNPFLDDVKVTAEIVKQIKGEKVISYKYLRRKDKHWKKGFRSLVTCLRIKEIAAK